LQTVILAAVEDLQEDLRTALMLREFDGLSYEEIAEIMACPVGTVRSRIFRARETIEKKMAQMG
jgi:RNA polymerase sigma-70 factor (ECF subfamily)